MEKKVLNLRDNELDSNVDKDKVRDRDKEKKQNDLSSIMDNSYIGSSKPICISKVQPT